MGTGTDVAIESAGVTLVKGDLLGNRSSAPSEPRHQRNVRQNLFFAFRKLCGRAGGRRSSLPFSFIAKSDDCRAAMSFSSVSVISNALLLRRAEL